MRTRYSDASSITATGAVHFLEMAKEAPLIKLPCGHHRCERFFDGAIKAIFGDKTDSPLQTECNQFKKWFAENKDSIPETVHYDSNNPPLAYDDPFLVRCRDELVALKERLLRDDGLHLPRGDYEHVWEQVQVMIL